MAESTGPHPVTSRCQKKAVIAPKSKKPPSSPPSSSSASSSSFRRLSKQRKIGVYVGPTRHRWPPRGGGVVVQDLAVSLGMSFAAIISQVLDGKKVSRNKEQVEQLSLVCTSAVKESISNVYGDRFDSFLLDFEKSFHSTLKTLCLINGTFIFGKRNRTTHQVSIDEEQNSSVSELSLGEQEKITCGAFRSSSECEAVANDYEAFSDAVNEFKENLPLTSINNQLILHGQINQELAEVSHNVVNPRFSQAVLNMFEKSVMELTRSNDLNEKSVKEHTRSNDLKTFDIGLTIRKMQQKDSQIALGSYANMLERIKITMGISKASFKENKLRNQMLDTRHAELLRKCIDLLVGGLIIMSAFLCYGAYVFSYDRITEATLACSAIPKESRSWWIPKSVASLSSVWLMMRCHFVALSRIGSVLLLIVVIAYAIFQRSVMSGPATMPVTFILLILGLLCGVSGKLCVDTLGGSGFHWLLLWETFCLLHFILNVFPSALYYVLYGPINISHREAKAGIILPYWLRRLAFYIIISFAYPAMTGLVPFASLGIWKEHFGEKINLWSIGAETED